MLLIINSIYRFLDVNRSKLKKIRFIKNWINYTNEKKWIWFFDKLNHDIDQMKYNGEKFILGLSSWVIEIFKLSSDKFWVKISFSF